MAARLDVEVQNVVDCGEANFPEGCNRPIAIDRKHAHLHDSTFS